jgi:hypothetical protein
MIRMLTTAAAIEVRRQRDLTYPRRSNHGDARDRELTLALGRHVGA